MSDNNPLSTLRISLEMENLRLQIMQCLMDRHDEINALVQKRLDEVLNAETLAETIDASVNRCVKEAISEEISNFYRFGNGREVIARAVRETLGILQETEIVDE